jgi:ribosome-associated protein
VRIALVQPRQERKRARRPADPLIAGADNQNQNGEELGPSASPEARQLALAIAAAGLDKKATGVEIIDVCGKVDYADILVLMSGRSDRHVAAIAKGVQEDLKLKHGHDPLAVEGLTKATWVLLDFNDVVVHVFQQEARLYYDLEGLWIDAGRVAVPTPERGPRSAGEEPLS